MHMYICTYTYMTYMCIYARIHDIYVHMHMYMCMHIHYVEEWYSYNYGEEAKYNCENAKEYARNAPTKLLHWSRVSSERFCAFEMAYRVVQHESAAQCRQQEHASECNALNLGVDVDSTGHTASSALCAQGWGHEA